MAWRQFSEKWEVVFLCQEAIQVIASCDVALLWREKENQPKYIDDDKSGKKDGADISNNKTSNNFFLCSTRLSQYSKNNQQNSQERDEKSTPHLWKGSQKLH